VPRKPLATPTEIAREVKEGMQRYCAALCTDGAPLGIIRRIRELHSERLIWFQVLELLCTNSPQEVEKLLYHDLDAVTKSCDGLKLRREDLPKIANMFDDLAKAVSNEQIGPEGGRAVFDIVNRFRMATPYEPPKFAPYFVEGFRRHTRDNIAHAVLAQDLTLDHYNLNPESAIQNMRRGIGRVKREHERCLKLGIRSPYLDD
jgi:hypothetical protein